MVATFSPPDQALIDRTVQQFFASDTNWASFQLFKELLSQDSVQATGVLRQLMEPEHLAKPQVTYLLHNFDCFFDRLDSNHPEFLEATQEFAFPIGCEFQKKGINAETLLASLRLPEVGLDVFKHICLISAQLQKEYDDSLFDEILEKLDTQSLIKVIDSSIPKTTQGYTTEFHTFVAEACLLRLKPGNLRGLFFGSYPTQIDTLKHKLQSTVAAIGKHQTMAKPEAIATLVDLVWKVAQENDFKPHEVFSLFREHQVEPAVFAHKPETQASLLEVDLGL